MKFDRPQIDLPALAELGPDLLHVPAWRKGGALVWPFVLTGGFFCFAHREFWLAAIACCALLSFFTYGSISHDLVHRTLRLPRWLNEALLTAIELLVLRSGHAYRAAHLHHHAHFPDDEDLEAAAAKMSWPRAVLDGMTLQYRLWWWAMRRRSLQRGVVLGEGVAVAALVAGAVDACRWSVAPALYAALVIAGSWIFPIATTVIPHCPEGDSELTRTRLFRGRVLSILALGHLYHLEHHLYPQVPHQNWPKLARRLDPFFARIGLQPVKLFF